MYILVKKWMFLINLYVLNCRYNYKDGQGRRKVIYLGVFCKDVFEVFKIFVCIQLIDIDNVLKMCINILVMQIFV